MSSWYLENTTGAVVSSRIRLARNLSGMAFPSRMNEADLEKLKAKVKAAISDSNTPFAKSLKYIEMSAVPQNEVAAMVERHIISPEFAASRNRAIILSEDESISIMIGEEDHIRIQVILAGLRLEEAYDIAERIDNLLYSKLLFAFDKSLGYLTECPTNLGTGLRASVMLHLPVLKAQGEIGVISNNIAKIGFTVRGIYGEGTKSLGDLYQISNQITLGISEKNAIDNLKLITTQLIEKEMSNAKAINKVDLEDTVYRALGTLKCCRRLSGSEMMGLLSKIKLGCDLGFIGDINTIKILIENQPHMLMKKYGEMSPEERDLKRADDVRKALKNID